MILVDLLDDYPKERGEFDSRPRGGISSESDDLPLDSGCILGRKRLVGQWLGLRRYDWLTLMRAVP